jgi:hypothetical protein
MEKSSYSHLGIVIMTSLASVIRTRKWRTNEAVALATASVPIISLWAKLHPSPQSIGGIFPGLLSSIKGVDVEEFIEFVDVINKTPWFFSPLQEIMESFVSLGEDIKVETTKEIVYTELNKSLYDYFKTMGGIKNPPRFLDRVYNIPTKASLLEAIKATGYEYGEWIAEEMDCDEWAGRLWGALQRTSPGNLPIGFVSICGSYTENGEDTKGCHALLLALTDEGWVWIENTGKITTLSHWKLPTLHLDIGIF